MSTISDGTTTFTPIVIVGWESERVAANVLHDIINRVDDDVTFRPAGLREGTLTALCPTLEDAMQLEVLLAQPKKMTFADPDHPVLNMTFVVPIGTAIRASLDSDTLVLGLVEFSFKQVAP